VRSQIRQRRWCNERLPMGEQAPPDIPTAGRALAARARAPPVGQNPNHRKLLIADDRAQPRSAGSGQRDRVGIGGIGLAALPVANTRIRTDSLAGR